jgi:rod shape-determining protein MreC
LAGIEHGSDPGKGYGSQGSRTAHLMLYMLVAIALMAMDQRGQYIPRVRSALEYAIEPVYHLVELPARTFHGISSWFTSHQQLTSENQALRETLLTMSASAQLLDAQGEENRRLRALLDAVEGRRFSYRFAELVRVDLDPYAHKVLIDRGASDDVVVGQAVIDGAGVMGQVEAVQAHFSSVRLISDPDHALPVQINRTGLRTVAYGTGETERLLLPNVPFQADVRPGDLIVTSGLGDRFPPGFPVARVVRVNRETGGTFAELEAQPLAALGRGREVLLITAISDPTEAIVEQPQATAEPTEPAADAVEPEDGQ